MSSMNRCADITWQDETERLDAKVGDLVWNPKTGEGHVLVTEAKCGALGFSCGYCGLAGPCGVIVPQCECGKADMLDHHVFVMAPAAEGAA